MSFSVWVCLLLTVSLASAEANGRQKRQTWTKQPHIPFKVVFKSLLGEIGSGLLLNNQWGIARGLDIDYNSLETSPPEVVVGKYKTPEEDTNVQYRRIEEYFVPPINKNLLGFDEPILFKLNDSVSFGDTVQPTVINKDPECEKPGKGVYGHRWADDFVLQNADQLKSNLLELCSCRQLWGAKGTSFSQSSYLFKFDERAICIDVNGVDSIPCSETRPDVIMTECDGSAVAVGLTGVTSGCGFTVRPQVAIRLSAYISWIEEVINNN